MSRRKRATAARVALIGLVVAGCSSSELDRYFESGQYVEAARAFEADAGLSSDERALFRAGVAYALPGTQAHDPLRARSLLTRLLELYPESGYRGEASRMLAFVDREEELVARLAEVNRTLEELKAIDLGRRPGGSAARASEFNRLFEEGQYGAAARVFEADSSLHSAEHTLFRAGVAYALPGGVHSPGRARELFTRLLNLYPDTPYRDEVAWLTGFLDQETGLRRRIRLLDDELEELKAIDLGRAPDDVSP